MRLPIGWSLHYLHYFGRFDTISTSDLEVVFRKILQDISKELSADLIVNGRYIYSANSKEELAKRVAAFKESLGSDDVFTKINDDNQSNYIMYADRIETLLLSQGDMRELENHKNWKQIFKKVSGNCLIELYVLHKAFDSIDIIHLINPRYFWIQLLKGHYKLEYHDKLTQLTRTLWMNLPVTWGSIFTRKESAGGEPYRAGYMEYVEFFRKPYPFEDILMEIAARPQEVAKLYNSIPEINKRYVSAQAFQAFMKRFIDTRKNQATITFISEERKQQLLVDIQHSTEYQLFFSKGARVEFLESDKVIIHGSDRLEDVTPFIAHIYHRMFNEFLQINGIRDDESILKSTVESHIKIQSVNVFESEAHVLQQFKKIQGKFTVLSITDHPQFKRKEIIADVPNNCAVIEEGRVIVLKITDLKVIPPHLEDLRQIKHLYLISCPADVVITVLSKLNSKITVEIDSSDLAEFPEGLKNHVSLNRLTIRSTNIAVIPDWISLFKSLKTIDLSYNRIKLLPAAFYKLQRLREIYLSSNRISELSSSIRALKNCTWLSISKNKLASIPAEVGYLTNLEFLDLAENDLHPLPDVFSSLSKLRIFWFHQAHEQLVLPPSLVEILPRLRTDLVKK